MGETARGGRRVTPARLRFRLPAGENFWLVRRRRPGQPDHVYGPGGRHLAEPNYAADVSFQVPWEAGRAWDVRCKGALEGGEGGCQQEGGFSQALLCLVMEIGTGESHPRGVDGAIEFRLWAVYGGLHGDEMQKSPFFLWEVGEALNRLGVSGYGKCRVAQRTGG